MFAKNNRFHTEKEVLQTIKKGTHIQASIMYARFVLRSQNYLPRIAVIVGRKFDNRATKRNLVKRRIRAALRESWVLDTHGLDLVINIHYKKFTKGEGTISNYQDIYKDTQHIIRKIRNTQNTIPRKNRQ